MRDITPGPTTPAPIPVRICRTQGHSTKRRSSSKEPLRIRAPGWAEHRGRLARRSRHKARVLRRARRRGTADRNAKAVLAQGFRSLPLHKGGILHFSCTRLARNAVQPLARGRGEDALPLRAQDIIFVLRHARPAENQQRLSVQMSESRSRRIVKRLDVIAHIIAARDGLTYVSLRHFRNEFEHLVSPQTSQPAGYSATSRVRESQPLMV
jgi:hypothetical protein